MRYKTTLLALPLALILIAPGTADAQDRKPVIKDVHDASGQKTRIFPQGGVVRLVGRNMFLPKAPEGEDPKTWRPNYSDYVEVKIGSTKARVILASTWDMVQFIIPQSVKKGNHRVTLKIKKRGDASTNIKVVTPKEFQVSQKETASEVGGVSGAGQRMDHEQRILRSFKITRFELVRGSAGSTFEVEGVAKAVPDRLRVDIKLQYDEKAIKTRTIPILRGGFSTTFGPYSKKLLLGNYSVEMVFELGKQNRLRVASWLKRLSDGEKEIYGRILRRDYTPVGTGPKGEVTQVDRKKQQTSLQTHCLEMNRECGEMLEKLRGAYAVAVRSFYKKKGQANYNEDAYMAYLQRERFATNAEEARNIKKDNRFATASGHFKAREFKAWCEDEKVFGLIPRIRKVFQKHRDFYGQYICSMDQRAEQLGDFQIAIVLEYFQTWTTSLYKKSKLEVPATVAGLSMEVTPIKPPKRGMKFFRAKQRELLRQVGLEHMVQPE